MPFFWRGGTSCNNNGMVPTYEIVTVVGGRYVDDRIEKVDEI